MGKPITAREAARELGVSEKRVHELCRNGIIPLGVVIYLGRQRRFDQDGLRHWKKRGGKRLPGGWRWKPPGNDGRCDCGRRS
jgi:excisionase family DNA binding protein